MATLVRARHAAGLTQRALAARLERSYSFVWKLEAGERRLNVLEFIEIARILHAEPSELILEIEARAAEEPSKSRKSRAPAGALRP